MDHVKYYATIQRTFYGKDEIMNSGGGGNLAGLWAVGGAQRSAKPLGVTDVCPSCGWQLTGKFSRCPRCGADLHLQQCPYCGGEIFACHTQCPRCSAPLDL
jgi:hypothetical protein